jgi:carbon monoxide dehydrogenase subunit G
MTTLERSIVINAPADAVDAFTSDAARWPEWYPGVEQAESDGTYPQVGGVVKVVYKAAGTTFNMTFTSAEYTPGRGIAQQMAGMFTGTSRFTLEPEGDSTRVTYGFEYEMPGGGVGKIIDKLLVERMNAENLEKSLKNLKAMLEA